MIENFDPSPALRSSAPTVTALIYTGNGVKPIELTDLALCVETGEIVPLSEPAFAVATGRELLTSGAASEGPVMAAIADLLRCEPTLSAFNRVASLALLQASGGVPERKAETALAEVAARPQVHADTKTRSLEALLAEMDAASHRVTESASK